MSFRSLPVEQPRKGDRYFVRLAEVEQQHLRLAVTEALSSPPVPPPRAPPLGQCLGQRWAAVEDSEPSFLGRTDGTEDASRTGRSRSGSSEQRMYRGGDP